MARPLSIDLRERAVAAVLKGGLSRHRVAAQFGVVPSTVINWVRRFQETGSVAPGQMGGHKPKAIAGEHHAWVNSRSPIRCARKPLSRSRIRSRSVSPRCRS
jgi:putative transposase